MQLRSSLCMITLLCIIPGSPGLPSRRLQEVETSAEDFSAYRKAGCDNFTNHQWQPLRPGYHITVPYGWLNDPHGIFQLNGSTHVFFQYNPKAVQWGAPFWGHVVSTDLAHWTWLPPALLPDQQYDRNGVWSGSATIDNAGTPVLTYTAAGSYVPEMRNFFQQQAMAVPENIHDPLLKNWRKSPANPFLSQVPPGGTNLQFRDPTEAKDAVWTALTDPQNPDPLPQSHYALAVGSQAFCMGGAGIYTAPNMTGPWSYVGTLYNQLAVEPQINGQCMASRIPEGSSKWPSPAYGGPCDQFGASCRMWEVVDFLELAPGLYMIKWDDQSHFRDLFSMEWYVLGNGPWDYTALHPKHASSAASSTGNTGSTVTGLSSTSSTVNTGSTAANNKGYVLNDKLLRKFGDLKAGSTPPCALPGIHGGSNGSSGTSKGSSTELGQQYATYLHSERGKLAATSDSYVDFNYVDAAKDAATKSLFKGELDGRQFAPLRTDYGSVYASTVFKAEDGRQVMLSWVYDTAAGCIDMCSDQLPGVIAEMGFKGVHTLPRQLSYNPATKTLRAYPVQELTQLRGAQRYNATGVILDALALTTLFPVGRVNGSLSSSSSSSDGGGQKEKKKSSGSINTARQLEVQLNFTLQPSDMHPTHRTGGIATTSSSSSTASILDVGLHFQPEEFAMGLRILLSEAGDKYVDVYLRGLVGRRPGFSTPSITALSVGIDRSHAGNATNTTHLEGGPVPLPTNNSVNDSVADWSLPDQPLGLSVWVDHSVIEVFAMGGLARITSRIYPDDDDIEWGLSVWTKPPTAVPVQQQYVGNSSTKSGSGSWGVLGGSRADVHLVVTRDADANQSGAGNSTGPRESVWNRLQCWWCTMWYGRCRCHCSRRDLRCLGLWHVHNSNSRSDGGSGSGGGTGSGSGAWQHTQEQQSGSGSGDSSSASSTLFEWSVSLDGVVWEVRNAWLPPSC